MKFVSDSVRRKELNDKFMLQYQHIENTANLSNNFP